jgi:hypothetical protein
VAEANGKTATKPAKSASPPLQEREDIRASGQFGPITELSLGIRYAGGGRFGPIPRFGSAPLSFTAAPEARIQPQPLKPVLDIAESDDVLEREAERVAERVSARLNAAPGATPPDPAAPPNAGAPPALPFSGSRPRASLLQRASLLEVAGETAGITAKESRPAGLIVDDGVETLTPGQMTKSRFLEHLREVACETAERELRRVGRTAQGCPYIEQMLARYARRSAAALERAIRRYAPETTRAQQAEEYLPLVSTRLAQGIVEWQTTGKLPDGLPDELKPGRLGDVLEAAVSVGQAAMAGAKALFKGKEGGAKSGVDAHALADRLGPGKPLEGSARSRMEWAFGRSFEDVRVHTDDHAASLSRSLHARAFAIGPHVAFGADEFRPGSPAGDALLAHELAHVVQQSGGPAQNSAAPGPGATNEALEQDADQSTWDAMAAIWGKGSLGQPRRARARRRVNTQPRLSRCAADRQASPASAYDRALLEGTQLLKGVGFGVQWSKENCNVPMKDSFDEEFWEKVPGECKLRARKKTSLAVAAMFDPARKAKWKLDCEQFSQVVHFYAILKTRGADALDQLVGEHVEITPLAKSGKHALPTKILWGRAAPGEKMKEHELDKQGVAVPKKDGRELTIDELLAVTPFGSRVTFENGHPQGRTYAALQNFQFENTLFVGKDRFVEHPLVVHTGISETTNILTSEEIIDMMAKASDPYVDESRPLIFISEIEFFDVPSGDR